MEATELTNAGNASAASKLGARARELLQSSAAVSAATWLVTAVSLGLLVGSRGGLEGNECDVLPGAKQFMDHGWLPNDWYLNLPIGYRYAFNIPVGMALKFASFASVGLWGRMLIVALFAAAAVAMCRAFEVSLWLCLPWIYLFSRKQGLVAGEWILAGLDTKSFAYVAAMFAFASLARRRYSLMAAWLGAALSFHLLVGLYANLCTLACLALSPHRPAWKQIHRWGWPGLITGGLGLAALLGYAFSRGDLDPQLAQRGAEIYVTRRVPHHVLPNIWPQNGSWQFWLEVCGAGALLLRVLRNERYRSLGQYMLGATGLFLVGLVLAHYQRVGSLRLYWFRYGDTMLVLLGWFGLALLLSDLPKLWKGDSGRALRLGSQLLFATIFAWALFSCALPYALARPMRFVGQDLRPRELRTPNLQPSAMHRWIAEHTEKGARFLIEPGDERFYVEAQRAVFVSFKHSPQSEREILEWFTRMSRLNGGRPSRSLGFGWLRDVSAAYRGLNERTLLGIAKDYQLDYVVTPNGRLELPKVHQERGQTLYRLIESN